MHYTYEFSGNSLHQLNKIQILNTKSKRYFLLIMPLSYKHRINTYHNIEKIRIHAICYHNSTSPNIQININTAIKVFAPCTNYILFSIIALNELESDETK